MIKCRGVGTDSRLVHSSLPEWAAEDFTKWCTKSSRNLKYEIKTGKAEAQSLHVLCGYVSPCSFVYLALVLEARTQTRLSAKLSEVDLHEERNIEKPARLERKRSATPRRKQGYHLELWSWEPPISLLNLPAPPKFNLAHKSNTKEDLDSNMTPSRDPTVH